MTDKTIYFYIDPKYGSAYLRGWQVRQKLRQLGYNARIITRPNPNIRDSIIFCVKTRILNTQIFDTSNFIIWDSVDFIDREKRLSDFTRLADVADIVVYHNTVLPHYFKSEHNIEKEYRIIPHHWDARIQNTKPHEDKFSIGYIGNDISSIHLNLIQNKYFIIGKNFLGKHFVDELNKYSCHFDIKDPDHFKFKTCSAMKLSTAAAVNKCIILNKTWSNLDLLPENSILFTEDSSEEAARSKIEEIASIYQTPEWDHILIDLQKIKEKTSLDNIIKLYENIIIENAN